MGSLDLSKNPKYHLINTELVGSTHSLSKIVIQPGGCGMDFGIGGNLDYTGHMKRRATQPAEQEEKRPLYVPGSQGRFITSHELGEWWRSCKCQGQAPTLEVGDRWFIDSPMMWEARGETILTRTLHVLPPQLWRHLN